MVSRLSYAFQPLADLYFLLTDLHRRPTSADWAPALDAIDRCLQLIADSPVGRRRADVAFHGHIAEHRTVDELAAAAVPEDGLLGLPWSRLVAHTLDALRAAEPLYRSTLFDERRAIAEGAITDRVRPVLGPREDECLAYIHDRLEIPDAGMEIPVVIAASVPRLPFTSLSDRTGAICFVGVDGLDGTSLLETILHEATHAIDGFDHRRASVLERLARAVEAAFPDGRAVRDVPHSLIFVQAAETTRRVVDPDHFHYGVTHTYYERVPSSKPVVEHWVAHLDGAFDADTAIERIVDDLRR
jgi:hypothetical protein